MFYVVYDMKGNSIWFNSSFMEALKKDETQYLKINLFDVLENFNEGHPVHGIMKETFENQPKTMTCKRIFSIFDLLISS